MRFLKTYEHFNITNNLSEDTNQVLNPALKQEIEHYVDELIEKNYNKLLKMLGIDVSDREVDFDELKIRAIEFFIEEPERMKKVNISFNSLPTKTNIIPKFQNIGLALRENRFNLFDEARTIY